VKNLETKAQKAYSIIYKRIAMIQNIFLKINEAKIKMDEKESALYTVRKLKIAAVIFFLEDTDRVRPNYSDYLLIIKTFDDVERQLSELFGYLAELSVQQGKPVFKPIEIEKYEATELTGSVEEGWAV